VNDAFIHPPLSAYSGGSPEARNVTQITKKEGEVTGKSIL
jgi:hypothetical protein